MYYNTCNRDEWVARLEAQRQKEGLKVDPHRLSEAQKEALRVQMDKGNADVDESYNASFSELENDLTLNLHGSRPSSSYSRGSGPDGVVPYTTNGRFTPREAVFTPRPDLFTPRPSFVDPNRIQIVNDATEKANGCITLTLRFL